MKDSKNYAMFIAVLLLLLCNHLIHVNAFTQCCQKENILLNGTCSDGANATILNCEVKIFMGPAYDPPVAIEIVDDDLRITEDELTGYYIIAPDKYCITKDSENGTEFAVVCVETEEQVQTATTMVLFYIKLVCAFISVLFLTAILIVYLFIPDLRDVEGKCILNMIAALLVAYLVICFMPLTTLIEPNPCDITAFMYCTALLCCDNWLSVISFHIWRITLRPIFQAHINWFWVYCGYGYGLPFLLLITALIMHYSQKMELTVGETQCLFDGNTAVWAYFYGPAMIMIFISMGLQFWTAKKLWMEIDRRDNSRSIVRLRKKSLMYMHLLLVVGLAQIIDMISYIFLAVDDYLDYMWDLLDCRNLVSGGAIFFILVVLRNKVLKALAKRGLFCIKFPEHWEKLKDKESEEVECDERELTRDSAGL